MKKIILKNGLRVVLVPQKQSLTTTVLVLVEAGSEYEKKDINGISHFLEHMCFKGTKNRPTALAITSEMESLGAVYNAFTGHEVTGYYAKVNPEKINSVLDIIADMYMNPVFDEKEIEKEKGVIIEEINMREDIPMHKVNNLFFNLVYGDQPAGWDIAGAKEVVLAIDKQKIINYRKLHYTAPATVVAIAGAFDEKKMLSNLKEIFGGLEKANKIKKPGTSESQQFPRQIIQYKESDQSHLVMGFRAFDMFDNRKYALKVLVNAVGGGMSSRLFQRIRDEMGAAYYIKSGKYLLLDHGVMLISAGAANSKVESVIEAILEELKKVVDAPLGKEELEKAKNHIIGHFLSSLETSDELASFYGERELFGEKLETPQNIVKEIKKVTAAEVQKVAKEIFVNKNLNLALIGPFKESEKFEKVLKL